MPTHADIDIRDVTIHGFDSCLDRLNQTLDDLKVAMLTHNGGKFMNGKVVLLNKNTDLTAEAQHMCTTTTTMQRLRVGSANSEDQ